MFFILQDEKLLENCIQQLAKLRGKTSSYELDDLLRRLLLELQDMLRRQYEEREKFSLVRQSQDDQCFQPVDAKMRDNKADQQMKPFAFLKVLLSHDEMSEIDSCELPVPDNDEVR